jgi:ribosome-binding factor A
MSFVYNGIDCINQSGTMLYMKRAIKQIDNSMAKLIELQLKAEKLPRLSFLEKTKFDQGLAIDQLYYSSKLEGSTLTKEGIEEAIHGKIISAA